MNPVLAVFLIVMLGYLLGSIHIRGISLGTSGILLVALVMGHFDITVPSEVKNLGLACFVTAVGIMAGPVFFENFKRKATNYIVLGILTILSGALVCVVVIKAAKIPAPLAVGLLNGALTSTPGLAAALEATGDAIVSVGYGIAYPFGVLGVVLFVQLVPRIVKTDMQSELAAMGLTPENEETAGRERHKIEPLGLFPFALAIVTGALLGNISIPLPGGVSFSFGISGGPLLTGLLIGHLGHIGSIDLSVKKPVMDTMREFGLAMFLLGAGTEAGQGFIAVLQEYGWILFLMGALMTLIPMILSFFAAVKLMKLGVVTTLGSICGGMTSTPALGTLIAVVGNDAVAAVYAATYPVALISVVMCSQFISVLC